MEDEREPTTIDRRKLLQIAAAAGAGFALESARPRLASASSLFRSARDLEGVKRGGTLRVGTTGGSSDSLDPNLLVSSNAADYRMTQLYEPLVNYTPGATLNVQMRLAQEVTAKNPSTWIIRLRKGLTFHDGKEVTADDVIFSLRRALKPTNNLLGLVQGIDGHSLKKLDKHTVQVHLKAPDAMMLEWLPYVSIIPVGWNAKKPVGAGPFKFKSYTPGNQSTFVRFADYWEEGKPYLDQVVTYSFQDETARINALLGGQLDLAPDSTRSQAKVITASPNLTISPFNLGSFQTVGMNMTRPPFSDVRVREAFRLMIDREQLVKQVYNGHAQVANDLYCPLDPDFDHALPPRHKDIGRAKALLKAAGAQDVSLTLVTAATFPDIVEMATAVAQQLKDAGVKVKVNNLDPSVFYGPQYNRRQFSTGFWQGSPLAVQIRFSQLANSPFNQTHWQDPTFAKLFRQAGAQTNRAKRRELMHELQKIVYEKGTFIIPVYLDQLDAHAKKVTAYRPIGGTGWPDWPNIQMA